MNHLETFTTQLYKKLTVQHNRSLTEGEKILARSVFGSQLRMDNIRLKTAWWVIKNYAVSPNGNIYFHYQNWVEDFADESLYRQAWLIHELTHVWQLQQGLNVVRKAMIDRRYNYVLKEGESFFKYGIEQQARMVEDYFVKMTQQNNGAECEGIDELENCIPFLTNTVNEYN